MVAAATKRVQPVKFAVMISAGRVVEAMKHALKRISARMKFVVLVVVKMSVVRSVKFALRHVVRLVVATTRAAA